MKTITKTINIYKISELDGNTQNKIINQYIDEIVETTDFENLNKNTNLYKAYKKSIQLKTPWFLGQFVWEYCQKQIIKDLKQDYYTIDGELVKS